MPDGVRSAQSSARQPRRPQALVLVALVDGSVSRARRYAGQCGGCSRCTLPPSWSIRTVAAGSPAAAKKIATDATLAPCLQFFLLNRIRPTDGPRAGTRAPRGEHRAGRPVDECALRHRRGLACVVSRSSRRDQLLGQRSRRRPLSGSCRLDRLVSGRERPDHGAVVRCPCRPDRLWDHPAVAQHARYWI